MTFIYFLIFILFIFLYLLYNYYCIDYNSKIKKNCKIKDFTKWILSDKYIAKRYAKLYGFKIPKTYQICKYPHNIKILEHCVIKPIDLCDSTGIYIIKNNKIINRNTNKNNIIKELQELRSKIFSEHYMHKHMYNGLIPYSGYIVEELLLDNNNIPSDYKCYVFNGKIYFISMTYNRNKNNGIQTFNSLWFNREWKPIYFDMIKKGYKFNNNIKKPYGFNKMIKLVENIGKKLKRHCRIDVYLIKGEVYLGEFTFFTGARLHTFFCNLILGYIWINNKDNILYEDINLKKIIPDFYINHKFI